MTARAYPRGQDDDFVFPDGEPTKRVKVRCWCGMRSVRNFLMCEAFIQKLARRELIRPDDLAGSSWCRDCHTLVKVTARALHLA
jgi:hypothetical protein